jgi:hypothetical protein
MKIRLVKFEVCVSLSFLLVATCAMTVVREEATDLAMVHMHFVHKYNTTSQLTVCCLLEAVI